MNNDFYGLISTLYGKFENADLNFGLVGNQYCEGIMEMLPGYIFPIL
ncbi:hypothetical protein [Chryseobacterium indoltheticum]